MMTNNGTTVDIPTLRERAVLVRLRVSPNWQGRKLDKRESAKLVRDKNAKRGSHRVWRQIIDPNELREVTSAIGALRSAFYDQSNAWNTDGTRLAPSALVAKLETDFIAGRDRLETATRALARDWPAIVARQDSFVGDSYNPADYPADCRGLWAIDWSFLPMPDGKDFRVDLPDDQLARIAATVDSDIRDGLKAATCDMLNRLVAPLEDMARALREYGAPIPGAKRDGATRTFRDSLVGNLRELAKALPALNVAADATVEAMIDRLRDVAEIDAAEYRQAGEVAARLRTESADSADQLASDIASIIESMGGDASCFLAGAAQPGMMPAPMPVAPVQAPTAPGTVQDDGADASDAGGHSEANGATESDDGQDDESDIPEYLREAYEMLTAA